MAPNDIYNNKRKYERFLAGLDRLLKPENGSRKYRCRVPANLRYARQLADMLAARDTSYVRRLRLMGVLKIVLHVADRDLRDCEREQVNAVVAFAHGVMKSPESKRDFIKNLRFLWRQLLPELDDKGRMDETVVPHAVRHLCARIDRSRERRRRDKMTFDEVPKLIQGFASDKRMQAFIAVTYESLARPQELLYVRIGAVELFDNYAKVWINDHGKEGTGFLQCIDSHPYLVAWLNEHPKRDDPDAFLFCTLGNSHRHGQMNPATVNKHLRNKCRELGIAKPITGYSLKRNGVTHALLRGDNLVSIQHKARWTSIERIKDYDKSDADDTFQMELRQRNLIGDENAEIEVPAAKTCGYCQTRNGIADMACRTCKRPLDRKAIEQEAKSHNSMASELADLKKQFAEINRFMNRVVARDPGILERLANTVRTSFSGEKD